MNVVNELNKELLGQQFSEERSCADGSERYKETAYRYARIEQSLAVLSDMHANASYLFYGGFAKMLGLEQTRAGQSVHSIWEQEILRLIHPDDLKSKYLQELRFFHYMKHLPRHRREYYGLVGKLRMKDAAGNYLQVMHRMFYLSEPSGGGIRFALCLYNPLVFDVPPAGAIVNLMTGEMQELEVQNVDQILTEREIQVLRLIDKGWMSKNIAALLSISTHTVSRHRQEILKKFQVRNSIEACRIAKDLGILK